MIPFSVHGLTASIDSSSVENTDTKLHVFLFLSMRFADRQDIDRYRIPLPKPINWDDSIYGIWVPRPSEPMAFDQAMAFLATHYSRKGPSATTGFVRASDVLHSSSGPMIPAKVASDAGIIPFLKPGLPTKGKHESHAAEVPNKGPSLFMDDA